MLTGVSRREFLQTGLAGAALFGLSNRISPAPREAKSSLFSDKESFDNFKQEFKKLTKQLKVLDSGTLKSRDLFSKATALIKDFISSSDSKAQLKERTNKVFQFIFAHDDDPANYQTAILGGVIHYCKINHPKLDGDFTKLGLTANVGILEALKLNKSGLQQFCQDFGIDDPKILLDKEDKEVLLKELSPIPLIFDGFPGFDSSLSVPYTEVSDESFFFKGRYADGGIVVNNLDSGELESTIANEVSHYLNEKLKPSVGDQENEFISDAASAYYDPLTELACAALNPHDYKGYKFSEEFARQLIKDEFGEEFLDRECKRVNLEGKTNKFELTSASVESLVQKIKDKAANQVSELEAKLSLLYINKARSLLGLDAYKDLPTSAK